MYNRKFIFRMRNPDIVRKGRFGFAFVFECFCFFKRYLMFLLQPFTTAAVFTIHKNIQFPCDLKNLIFSWFEYSPF